MVYNNQMKAFIIVFLTVLVSFITALFLQLQLATDNQQLITDNYQPTTYGKPTPTAKPIPEEKTLLNEYHIFQSFNNCGPAALSMALSYYDIQISQSELGHALRPYQIPNGDNDDKSVTLDELAKKASEYNLLAYHRPNGSIQLIQSFIAGDIPVITRTWLKENEDIGHYRIVKGYNKRDKTLIQDDSLQGKNLTYSEKEFLTIWGKFNYEYLVLVPKDKQEEAEAILGEDVDEKTAWEHAVKLSQKILENDPDDRDAQFNLSVAYFHTGYYQKSVEAYEKVADSLSFRTLWYQIEPIQAYYELGRYDDVFRITNKILNNQNKAFSELYLIRGDIYKKQGKVEEARSEYEKAVFYNSKLQEVKKALEVL